LPYHQLLGWGACILLVQTLGNSLPHPPVTLSSWGYGNPLNPFYARHRPPRENRRRHPPTAAAPTRPRDAPRSLVAPRALNGAVGATRGWKKWTKEAKNGEHMLNWCWFMERSYQRTKNWDFNGNEFEWKLGTWTWMYCIMYVYGKIKSDDPRLLTFKPMKTRIVYRIKVKIPC
jgi:hypothetical protein